MTVWAAATAVSTSTTGIMPDLKSLLTVSLPCTTAKATIALSPWLTSLPWQLLSQSEVLSGYQIWRDLALQICRKLFYITWF